MVEINETTIKAMSLGELENQLDKLNDEADKINKKRVMVIDQIREIERQKERELLEIKKQEDEIDWEWVLNSNNQTSVKYKYRAELLDEIGLWSNGSLQESGQVILELVVDRNATDQKLKILEEKLCEILPHIKPLYNCIDSPYRGYKLLGIIDESLNANGLYSLLINENSHKYLIVDGALTHSNLLAVHDNLLDCLKTIRKDYSYS
ncbi:MAG: hypothetical protein ACOCQR_02890 [bacterium]